MFFPWDWEAVIHFPPVDLLWFLLKHVTAPGFDQSKQHVTPFRVGMVFCKYYDLKIKSREIAAGELYYK